jgi:hypothetical protein
MTSDRKRATLLIFQLDNLGKVIYEKLPVYSGYHKGDIKRVLEQLGIEKVLVINYQHGNTKTTINKLLKNYNHLAYSLNSKFKVMTISDKESPICLEINRLIVAEELWRLSL